MLTPTACVECGNDDPADGFRVCSDCLEAWLDMTPAERRLAMIEQECP